MISASIAVLSMGLLTALALLAPLRFQASVIDRQILLRLRWTVLTLGFDTTAQEVRLSLFARRVYRKRTDEKRPFKPKKERKATRRVPARQWLEERDALLAQLRYLLRHIELERLDADVTLATSDPALTGALYGLAIGFVYPLATLSPKVSLIVAPDFTSERPSGRVDAAFSVRLIYLVVIGWQLFRLNRRLLTS